MQFQYITSSSIDICAMLASAHHRAAGAVVLFSGEPRDFNTGKEVLYLEYEAFIPMAELAIEEILLAARNKWNLHSAVCQHRLGKVGISECAVCVITTSVHRQEAYEANQYIIDRVKHEAPIWKKEYFDDGSYSWGNNCSCHPMEIAAVKPI